MTWGDLLPDDTLAWIGKGRKPRTLRIGVTFAEKLARWRRAYEAGIGRPANADDPLVCRMNHANQHTTARRPDWGKPICPDTFRKLLLRRAAAAGLGHVAPHDLRRTTANLLDSARSADGGRLFDATDIQKVLGHSRLSTTQWYLDALNTDAIDRAGPMLDL